MDYQTIQQSGDALTGRKRTGSTRNARALSPLCIGQCAKRRHRSSVDKTENALFVREHSENLFLAVFTNTKNNEKHHQKRRNTGSFVHFCSFARKHTDFWCSRGGMSVNTPKNGGGFRERRFHWGGRSSRPTARPTRVCASSRRWCEYHRPVVWFVV